MTKEEKLDKAMEDWLRAYDIYQWRTLSPDDWRIYVHANTPLPKRKPEEPKELEYHI